MDVEMDSPEKFSQDIARKRVHFISELLRLNLDESVSEHGAIRSRHVELARGQLEDIKALLASHPELKFNPLEKCEARLVQLEEMAGIGSAEKIENKLEGKLRSEERRVGKEW